MIKKRDTINRKNEGERNSSNLIITNQPQVENEEQISKTRDEKAETSTDVGNIKHESLLLEKSTVTFDFITDSFEPAETAEKYLVGIVQILYDDKYLKVDIIGHADNVGGAEYNQKLSEKRANAIKEFLIKLGIPENRINAMGKGEKEPLNDNLTPINRAKNRRVELNIYY